MNRHFIHQPTSNPIKIKKNYINFSYRNWTHIHMHNPFHVNFRQNINQRRSQTEILSLSGRNVT